VCCVWLWSVPTRVLSVQCLWRGPHTYGLTLTHFVLVSVGHEKVVRDLFACPQRFPPEENQENNDNERHRSVARWTVAYSSSFIVDEAAIVQLEGVFDVSTSP
jgi:hypothetical protein